MTEKRLDALRRTLSGTVSLTGVTAGILEPGEELVEVLSGGKGEEKLKVGNADVLMGSKMAGSSGTSTTCSQKTSRSNTLYLCFSYWMKTVITYKKITIR